MVSNNSAKLQKFQDKIQYTFQNIELLKRALTTPRYGNKNNLPNYQVLETIGDAVIKLIVTLKIYDEGLEDPGKITRKKAKIENDRTLGMIASQIFNLEEYVYTSDQQFIESSGILADILEAISGALFLDSGLNLKIVESKIINKFYNRAENFIEKSSIYNKNLLLEFLQKKFRSNPRVVVDFQKSGSDNKPRWRAHLKAIFKNSDNEDIIEIKKKLKSGAYSSKKDAENDLYKKIYTYVINMYKNS